MLERLATSVLLARLFAPLAHEFVVDVVAVAGIELVALFDNGAAVRFGDCGAIDVT
jgi:hypothetical protein